MDTYSRVLLCSHSNSFVSQEQTLKLGFSSSQKTKMKNMNSGNKIYLWYIAYSEKANQMNTFIIIYLFSRKIRISLVMSRVSFSWSHSKAITKCYTCYSSFKSITKQVTLRLRSNSIPTKSSPNLKVMVPLLSNM